MGPGVCIDGPIGPCLLSIVDSSLIRRSFGSMADPSAQCKHVPGGGVNIRAPDLYICYILVVLAVQLRQACKGHPGWQPRAL